MLKKDRGLTLIEIMVVLFIIGVLSAVVVAGVQGAKSKGRDAQRINDLQQMKLVLERYYQNAGHYPDDGDQWLTDCEQLGNWIPDNGNYNWSSVLMPTQPKDPSGACGQPSDALTADNPTAAYVYFSNAGKDFALVARLENPSQYDIQHADTKWIDGGSLYTHYHWLGRAYAIIQP